MEYFDTIEEPCAHLMAYTGMEIKPTWEALEESADNWNNCHEDSDWPVSVKRIEVVFTCICWMLGKKLTLLPETLCVTQKEPSLLCMKEEKNGDHFSRKT